MISFQINISNKHSKLTLGIIFNSARLGMILMVIFCDKMLQVMKRVQA